MPSPKSKRAKAESGDIHIGVGGWTYAPWRGEFYPPDLPQKSELQYASRRLTSIEINGTYYGSQKPETFARWRDETPDSFVFSVKAPRFATNRRVLAEAGKTIDRFLGGGVMRLGDRLAVINWQFLPSKAFDADDFAAFLRLLPGRVDGRTLRHVVEVRHESFRTAEFIDMVREHQVAIAIAGDAEYPQIADLTAPFVYARIMGTQPTPKRGYREAALDRWAVRARQWASGAAPAGLTYVTRRPPVGLPRDVYLYVISGHKVHNPAAALALIDRVDED
jgi:uncharacterized protein YecE (DUF72 family)